MLDIAICEDERFQQGELEEMLYTLGKKLGIYLEVSVYERGESLLAEVDKRAQYDVIYLDIEMEGMDGIRVAEELRNQDRTMQIIYVTHHERYVRQSLGTVYFVGNGKNYSGYSCWEFGDSYTSESRMESVYQYYRIGSSWIVFLYWRVWKTSAVPCCLCCPSYCSGGICSIWYEMCRCRRYICCHIFFAFQYCHVYAGLGN